MNRAKVCRLCAETLPLREFSKRTESKDGHNSACRQCCSGLNKADYAANREARRARKQAYLNERPDYFLRLDLIRKYGITLEDYNDILEAQEGMCACCGTAEPGGRTSNERFHVDHDHETGAIRGLLCHRCNTGLGLLGDNVDGVMAALMYLLRSEPALNEVLDG